VHDKLQALDRLGRRLGLWSRHDGKGQTTAALVVILEGLTSGPRDPLRA